MGDNKRTHTGLITSGRKQGDTSKIGNSSNKDSESGLEQKYS